MIPPLINMYLMEIDFTYFIGTVMVSQIICILSFFGIWKIGKKLKQRSDNEKAIRMIFVPIESSDDLTVKN